MIHPFLIFAAALIFTLPAQAQEGGNFRGLIWGLSKEDVRAYEKATFYMEEGDALYFLEQPDGFRKIITYDFTNGKLSGGKMEYVELHDPSPAKIMDMFGARQIELEREFGEPESVDFRWKDRTYLNHPQFWTRALRSGDLRMIARWQTDDTRIMLETYHDGDYYRHVYEAIAGAPQQNPDRAVPAIELPGLLPDARNIP